MKTQQFKTTKQEIQGTRIVSAGTALQEIAQRDGHVVGVDINGNVNTIHTDALEYDGVVNASYATVAAYVRYHAT
jgi:hypothetical protein